MVGGADLYILLCADGRYYVGTTRNGLEHRVAEHNSGAFGGYTSKRLPVRVVFSQHFESIADAIAAER
jgi:predicted GIY-YIG superfamily endonuclease